MSGSGIGGHIPGNAVSQTDEAKGLLFHSLPTTTTTTTTTTNKNIKRIRKDGAGAGWRHVMTALLFFGMLLFFMMRANMSVAIVAMTDPTDPHHYAWDMQTQARILSSFFWGYIVLQVPAGELARRRGGRGLLLLAMGANALLSGALPIAANWGGWQAVTACRVLQGVTQGCVYPAVHHMVSQWVPREENGLLTTVIYAGGQLGIAIQLLISGFLASSLGWNAIFYTNCILGALWTLAFAALGADSPTTSRYTSPGEKEYIQSSLGQAPTHEQPLVPPWRSIARSVPFLALCCAHCGQNWGFFTLMTEMPTYLSKVHRLQLNSSGALSCVPYLGMFALSAAFGQCTDVLLRRHLLSKTHTRKLFNTIGFCGPAVGLLGLAYTPASSATLAVCALLATVGLNAGQFAGFMLVHIDMAPSFSSTLMGVTNFLANIVSIIAPLVCGAIVSNESSEPLQWRTVFLLSAGVYFCCNVVFLLFATSETQPWNDSHKASSCALPLPASIDMQRGDPPVTVTSQH